MPKLIDFFAKGLKDSKMLHCTNKGFDPELFWRQRNKVTDRLYPTEYPSVQFKPVRSHCACANVLGHSRAFRRTLHLQQEPTCFISGMKPKEPF